MCLKDPNMTMCLFTSNVAVCDEYTVVVIVDVNKPDYFECPEPINRQRRRSD